ncbi:MAG: ABC transporter permease [SAR202 cluster bacterium]|nr:ABC transporter permease [SAR202 cluster bacterium]
MLNYIVMRTLLGAFTLCAIAFLSFVIIQLPQGDYVDTYIQQLRAEGDEISREQADAIRDYYGLNRPMLVQFWFWVSRIIFQLDFGYSFARQKTIKSLLADRLQFSIALSAFTSILVWGFSVPIGIYSAVRAHTFSDYVFTLLGFTGLALPDFLLGLVMMYVFFAYFDMSVGGLFSGHYVNAPWSVGRVIDLLKHLIIPGVVIGTNGMAGGVRILRNNLMDELSKPYVITARAKGVPYWRLVIKYPLRVAVNPMISGFGGILPGLIGGEAIVSIVLSLPTLGPLMLAALTQQDMYLAGSIFLLLSSLTLVGVLVSDLMLVVVDPRIRLTSR